MTIMLAGRPDPVMCGCDGAADALIPVDEALRRGLALATPVADLETLPLSRAHGRVLARALRSRSPLPRFDNSAMDGYALRLADLAGPGPWRLPLAGRIAAGDAGTPSWPRGSALRILTGAAVPPGCDAVAMQEEAVAADGAVTFRRRPVAGENIRRAGEDLPAGAPLLPGGRVIDPRAAAVLAAAGMGEVRVRRRVRVALFSTGSELREPGERLAPGQIWNANRHHLTGALALPWVDLLDMGVVPDDPAALLSALERAAYGADLVVTTGGISVGEEDHMPAVLARIGAGIHVMRLAMKPGKPLTIGQIGGAVYVGLPGNPVSAFVTWHVIGARIAEALAGIAGGGLRKTLVRAGFARDRVPGRCEFVPARLMGLDGTGIEVVESLAGSVSHRVALLAGADGLVLIPADCDHVGRGDLLEFIPF